VPGVEFRGVMGVSTFIEYCDCIETLG
jgi:hypothetical protein